MTEISKYKDFDKMKFYWLTLNRIQLVKNGLIICLIFMQGESPGSSHR
jgi:hypothetical protein